MTSIRRDCLAAALGVGERFRLAIEERDGDLVATHPRPASPADVVIVEGREHLESTPPAGPVVVEILDRFVGDRVAGRIVADRDE